MTDAKQWIKGKEFKSYGGEMRTFFLKPSDGKQIDIANDLLDQIRRDAEEIGHERGFKLATEWYERELKNREENIKEAKKELLDEIEKCNVLLNSQWIQVHKADYEQIRAKTLGEKQI